MIKYNQVLNRDIEGQKTTAIMSGGVEDPIQVPSASVIPKDSSTLEAGVIYVGYAWGNQYGQTMGSPTISISVAPNQELVVTLPTRPAFASKAFIYMGTSPDLLKLQAEITSNQYRKDTRFIEGFGPQNYNDSYEWVTPVSMRGGLASGNAIIGQVKLTDGSNGAVINANGSLNIVHRNVAGQELFTGTHPGQVQIRKRSAKEPFEGNANRTHTFSELMHGFVISNDGIANIQITIGSDTFKVFPGEVFDEEFDPFTTVTITGSSPYRAYGRG